MNYYLLITLLVFVNFIVLDSVRLNDEPNYYLKANGQVAQQDTGGIAMENTSGIAMENTSGTASGDDPLVSNYCQLYSECS